MDALLISNIKFMNVNGNMKVNNNDDHKYEVRFHGFVFSFFDSISSSFIWKSIGRGWENGHKWRLKHNSNSFMEYRSGPFLDIE